MKVLKKLYRRLKDKGTPLPLILTQELKDSFNTPSVTGGNINKKRAIVFGGTGGIGLATVERFLVEGCAVTVVGRNPAKLEEVDKYLKSRNYCNYDLMQFDSLNLRNNQSFIQEGFFKKYDFFVNTVGVYSKEDGNGSFRKIEGQLFFNEVNTNFKSAVVLAEVCLRDFFEKDEGGVIVNIGSINSEQRKFKFTPYGISKYALADYTKKTAKKLIGSHISMNLIQPGGVATNMPNVNVTLGRNIAGRKSNDLRRASLPEEMAAIIAFLCSPAGRNINGQIITASACEDF